MTNTLKVTAFLVTLACAMATMPAISGAQSATPPPQDPTAPTQPSGQTPQSAQRPTSAPAAANPSGESTKIAPGSVIPVELTKTVDAKKAKAGDEVVAKVTQDMKTGTGQVIVAKDTKMIGHVTQAQAHTKEQKQSELGITFEKVVSKSGEMKLPMSIQAIVAPPSNNSPDSGNSAPSEPSTAGTTASSPMNGRTPASGSAAQPQPQAGSAEGTDAKSAGNARPPINASTQGVIGIPNLTLATNADNSQGSVMTSEKNNVKLESGTMLLLRVSQ
jgi:hypothetical protein